MAAVTDLGSDPVLANRGRVQAVIIKRRPLFLASSKNTYILTVNYPKMKSGDIFQFLL